MSELFGEYYQAKIIEIILENYEEEMTIKDIMKMADTSQGSTYSYIKFLLKKNVLVESRKIGKTQLYKLNIENNITQSLLLFEHSLVTSELDKKIALEEEKIEASTTYKKYIENVTEYNTTEYSKPETVDLQQYVKKSNVTKQDVDKWKKLTL